MYKKQNHMMRCILFFLCLLLAGCATERALKEAQSHYDKGEIEGSLQVLSKALANAPTDAQLRTAYIRLRDRGLEKMLAAAQEAKRQGNRDLAKANYQRMLSIDTANSRAQNGLQEIAREERQEKQPESVRQQDKESAPSSIDKALGKSVSIEFKDALLKQVFEVFSRTTGVNFVFDKDIRSDQKTTVFLNNTRVREALDVVLFTNQLEQRTLDNNTILIYPNTPAKLKDYQALTIKGFFLANADPEPVANALKSLLKMKDVIVDKRQSLIMVRDTQEGVRLAEKLIALHDLPEPEVMLEVEILEINRKRLTELGIKYPSQLTLTPLTAVSGDTLTLSELRGVSASNLGAQISPIVVNARRLSDDAELLANPRIRVRNRDTAKILIGDKVPNITTTSTATGFVSSNVQYLDVGLKLEVVPTITVDNEVVIKISLEVSNITGQVATADRTVAYQIGTRSASTVLRLKDGENQVLAGLISDEDRRSANKVPGLGDLPLLGRLFASHLDDGKKSEIVLSITPRLVRNNVRPGLSVSEFESGTETNFRGLSSAAPSSTTAIAAIAATAATSLSLPPAAAPPAATVSWEAPAQVKAGDTFTLKLHMNSNQIVAGVPLTIGYDASQLEVVKVEEGKLLTQNGSSASFSQRVDKATGQIFITGTRNVKDGDKDQAGAPVDGSVAVLTLKSSGTSAATNIRLITITPLGLNGSAIPASVPPPLTINVTP